MKAVLLSVKPKWCKLIFSGEKTIEVRKTAPKLFDKPRELGEFGIARAPMSWQYVEELQ